jgi:hypothetical protein
MRPPRTRRREAPGREVNNNYRRSPTRTAGNGREEVMEME